MENKKVSGNRHDEIEETERLLRSSRELKEKFENDPYRPKYHFMSPGGWINDPTGAIYWKGRYHLFYEYYPDAAYQVLEYDDGSHKHLSISWGHASSKDLIHWVHHPIALQPSIEGVDGDSCFSGHIFDNNGVATIIYYGRPGGSCIATCSDYELDNWLKHPKAVIPQPKPGDENHGKYSAGDPSMWREGDYYYALCGFREPEGGDTASLFRSTDTVNWEYLHYLYKSDRKWTTAVDDCAVPDFFKLGHRHMLLYMSHETGAQYYLGRWENETFYPETHGHMNWPGGQLNAPKSMLDGKGRRLFWGWVCEGRTRDAQRAAGWASTLSLPRVLSLSGDGSLMIEPAEEMERLRHNYRKREGIDLDNELDVPEIKGDCLELVLEIDPGDATELGIKVRCSPDGNEETSIGYSPSANKLIIDTRKSSLREDVLQPWPRPWATLFSDPFKELETTKHVQVQKAPFELGSGELLKLRIFLDRSVLEVFANGRQCVTQRIYPGRDDSLGVTLFSRGGKSEVKSIEAWDMDAFGI